MQVRGYLLEGLGILVELKNVTPMECKDLPHVIAIVDTSGSMGSLVSVVLNGSLPTTMLEKGYSMNANVDVITFANDAKIMKINEQIPTIRSLQNEFFEGSGCTNMAGVFPLLKQFLNNRYSNICLLAISDGEISDTTDTLRAAKLCNESNAFSSHIDVAMIRLKSSSYANPDSSALACVGQFGTTNRQTAIYDVETTNKARDAIFDELSQIFMQHINSQYSTMKITGNNMKRSPCDLPTRSLNIVGDTCLLLPYEAKEIMIDDHNYKIEMQETLSLAALQFFCDYAKSQLKLQHVIGNDVAVMKHFFNKLDATLSSSSCEMIHQDMSSRIKSLNRQCNKALKTQIQEVLEIANQNKLQNLNNQQKADFLRTSTSTSLAKRTAKNQDQQLQRGENTSMQMQASIILEILRKTNDFKDSDVNERSFYSQSNNQESYESLLQENVLVDNLQDLDLLRLFGFMGICYHHQIGDVVDPYSFHIKQILGGGMLSSSDLREANSTKINQVQAELCAPGLSIVITGVIPLRFLNPVLFDILWQNGMKLLEMHTSINMRRMLAPVRSDLLGERIALLNVIMRENHDILKPISQRDQQVFDDIAYQLRQLMELEVNKQEFKTMIQKLSQGQCIRNDLTGSNCISCINKPLIAILQLKSLFTSEYLQDVLHILYEFDAYHNARHFFQDQNGRDDVIKKLFAIDVSKMLTSFPLNTLPYFPETNSNDQFRCDMVNDYVNQLTIDVNIVPCEHVMQWMPKTEHFAGYYRFLCNENDRKIPFQINAQKQISSMVASIVCDCEQKRIVDGQNQTYEWNNSIDENNFIHKTIKQFYIDFYIKEATLELQRRDNAELMTQIHLMSRKDVDFKSFVTILPEYIPNRNHTGYKLLMHEILQHDPIDCDKLALLITGRGPHGKIKFASGNFDEEFWSYKKYFISTKWQELVQLRADYGSWIYRKSNLPNHSGHSNLKKSYWATNIYPTLKK